MFGQAVCLWKDGENLCYVGRKKRPFAEIFHAFASLGEKKEEICVREWEEIGDERGDVTESSTR